MGMPSWLERLQRSSIRAAEEHCSAARLFRLPGQVFSCIDGRCSVGALTVNPFTQHRILGGHVHRENAAAVRQVVEAGAKQARPQNRPQLAVCVTHSDCAYLAAHDLARKVVWESYHEYLHGVPDTVLVWLDLEVGTGVLTVVGPDGTCADNELQESGFDGPGADAVLEQKIRDAGFVDDDVVHDLGWLIGSSRPKDLRCPTHQELGIVVGTVAGDPTHFSISPQFGDRREPLEVALGILRNRGVSPFIAVSVCNERSIREDSASLRELQRQVVAALYALGYEVPVCKILVVQTGALCLVR